MDASPRRPSRLPWIIGLAALPPVALIGLWIGWIASSFLRPAASARPAIADTATVIQHIQGLNELSTVKYVMEKVVLLQDVKWYGESRLIMVAHGVARAGVNLGALKAGDLTVRGASVRLKLPRAAMTDVFLDERRTQVIERTTGLLREFDKDLEQDARRQAVEQIRVAAAGAGILKDADERARLQVRALLRTLGFTDVEVATQK